MSREIRTFEELLADFNGVLPEQLKLLDLVYSLFHRNGWVDYNNSGVTPLALTLANTYYKITNDGAGPYTVMTYSLPELEHVWNTTTNQFDFTSFKLGDILTIRLTLVLNSANPNDEFNIRFAGAMGTPDAFYINFAEYIFKAAGVHPVSITFTLPIGFEVTRVNPGELQISCDDTGATVDVIGFVIEQIRVR